MQRSILLTRCAGRAESLRATLSSQGQRSRVDSLPHGAAVTFSTGGAAAESTSVERAPQRTGIWSLAVAVGNAIRPITDFSVITLKPASAKSGGKIGLYYLGNWPRTAGKAAKARYDAPSGFIEVTREQQGTELSDHFQLKDFFPHDQANQSGPSISLWR